MACFMMKMAVNTLTFVVSKYIFMIFASQDALFVGREAFDIVQQQETERSPR